MKIKWISVILVLFLAVSITVAIITLSSEKTTNVGSSLSLSPQEENHLLWSYQTGNFVGSVSISSDGSYMAVGSSSEVNLFSNSDNNPLWNSQVVGYLVAISSDGSYIAAEGGGVKVYLFSNSDNAPLWIYNPFGIYLTYGSVESISISSDGSYIAAGMADNRVYLFSRLDNNPLWVYQTGGSVESVSISSDGSYIAAGTRDNKVYLFSSSSSTPLWSYETGGDVISVSISSDGPYIAAGSEDDKVYLFSSSSSTPLWSYHTGFDVDLVAISSDGSYITAGSFWDIYLFSRTSGTPLWNYHASAYIGSVSISSDGNYIAAGSGSSDDRVYLFSRTGNTPLWSYKTGNDVTSVAISSDGSYMAAGDWDGNVYFLRAVNSPPSLSSGSVSPNSGTPGTIFTYEVTYTDADGDAPSYVRVCIDSTAHDMIKVSGTYTGGTTYSVSVNGLGTGSHTYYFEASDGIDNTRLPENDAFSGPTIQFEVTLTFNRPDGAPLANTTIYYGFSGDWVTNILGTTDNDGRLTTQENIGGQTIYFTSSDGKFAGSTFISSTSGEVTAELTEISEPTKVFESPILWVVAVIVVAVVIGAVVLVKKGR